MNLIPTSTRRILWFWYVPRRVAWIYRVCLWSLGIYALLFTFMWGMVVNHVIVAAFTVTHLDAPNDETPRWHHIREQPAFRAMCDFGNWVADVTRPLVSDEVMIAHWQEHHKEWEEALVRQPVRGTREEYARFDEYLKSIGLDRLYYDSSDHPERFANMTPQQSLGRDQDWSRPCVGRGGSSKGYSFYPEQPPVVLGNKVLNASSLEFAKTHKFEPMGSLLVESTDHVHYTYSMRRLTPYWFLVRWE